MQKKCRSIDCFRLRISSTARPMSAFLSGAPWEAKPYLSRFFFLMAVWE